jgi:hypothetical protein
MKSRQTKKPVTQMFEAPSALAPFMDSSPIGPENKITFNV